MRADFHVQTITYRTGFQLGGATYPNALRQLVKRLFDLLAASLLVVLLSPLLFYGEGGFPAGRGLLRAPRQVAALLLPLATGYNSSKFFAGG